MNKIPIDENTFVYPMPMVLVGSLVDRLPNFAAVGWVMRVNYDPPLIAVSLGTIHHTARGIRESGVFSVNVPNVDLVEKVDYCGMVSGRQEYKANLFKVFAGEETDAPLIEECPLCMECRVVDTVELPANTLFIGQIVGAYADPESCTDEHPDITKMRPFTLTMPDNQYWRVGENLGRAWNIGRSVAE